MVCQLANGLHAELADMTCLSCASLCYMPTFAAAWDEDAIIRQAGFGTG